MGIYYIDLIPLNIFGSSSGDHFCALFDASEQHQMKCWGLNSFGQLGTGDTVNRGDTPYPMSAIVPVNFGENTAVSVSLGSTFSCALLTSGDVKCWGKSDSGELGLGQTTPSYVPTNPVDLTLNAEVLSTVTKIASGRDFTCALVGGAEKLKCWGGNSFGQLGLGDPNNRGDGPNEMGLFLPPVDLGLFLSPIQIAAGDNHACAIISDGRVKCWGRNNSGQLGIGTTQSMGDGLNEMGARLPFVLLGTGRTAKAISAHSSSTCVILDNNKSKCFGSGKSGALGYAGTVQLGDLLTEMGDSLPFHVFDADVSPIKIVGGFEFTCALFLVGIELAKCWGNNAYGQLGMGNTQNYGDASTEPLSLSAPEFPYIDLGSESQRVIDIACSSQATCALLDTSFIKCFGSNSKGQLGIMSLSGKGDAPGEMGDNLAPVLFIQPVIPTNSPTSPTYSPTTVSPTTKSPTVPSLSPTTKSPVIPTPPTSSPTIAPVTFSPSTTPTRSPTSSPTKLLLNFPVSCNPFPYGTCRIGVMKLTSNSQCQCVTCPLGTYKTNLNSVTCSICGSAGNYCPNPESEPIPVSPGKCSYWENVVESLPSKDTSDFTTYNPYLFFTQAFSVILSGTTESLLASFVGTEVWGKERYGGLRKFRTHIANCGSLQVSVTSLSIVGIVPGVASTRFEISNTGELPINVTADAPTFATVFGSISTASLVANQLVVEPNSAVFIDVEIATHEIPDDMITPDGDDAGVVTFSISLLWKQYWSQSDTGVDTFTSVVIPVTLDLKSGKIVFTPEAIDVVMDAESTRTQRVTLYNILPKAQEWSLQPVVHLSTYQTWISFPNITSGTLSASCRCGFGGGGVCIASDSGEGDKFKASLLIDFNSTGLPAGIYRAKTVINSEFSGEISIPISMEVKAGVMHPEKTTWHWSDVSDPSNVIRVNNKLTLRVTPRDIHGSETLIVPNGKTLSDIKYQLSWSLVAGRCNPTYNNGTCAKSKYITYTDAGWVTQIQFPSNATFGIDLLYDGVQPISGVPDNDIKVSPIDCALYDSNSIPTEFGDSCKCVPGYGVVANSGIYVSCKICGKGFYDDGTSNCVLCNDGLYQDTEGQMTCKTCSSDAFEPTSKKDGCQQCQGGSVVGALTGSKYCETCPIGTYAAPSDTSCKYCARGSHEPNEAQTACIQCNKGSVVKEGDYFCSQCPEGMVAAQGDVECSFCSGPFEPSKDQSTCVECDPGFAVLTSDRLRFDCERCPEGTIRREGEPGCRSCSSSAFEPNEDQSDCVSCKAGYVVNAAQGSPFKCEKCPEGLIARFGDTQCKKCPSDAYEPNEDRNECNPCPGGYVVNATGSNSKVCERCPLGTIAPLGATKCSFCEDRIHAPNEDGTVCDLCPENRLVLPGDSNWICVPCDSDRIVKPDKSTEDPTDYFCACHPTLMNVLDPLTGEIKCEPCPVGGFCAYRFKDNLLPLTGYWQVPWDANRFQQCRNNDSCPGIIIHNAAELLDDSLIETRIENYTATLNGFIVENPIGSTCPGESLCKTGYTGPMCVKCEFGYTRVGEAICNKCLGREVTIGLLVSGLTLAIVITVYIIRRTILMTDTESNEVLLLKIMTSHMQMISMSATFRFNWPVWVLQFFSVLDLISSAGQTLLSLDCLVDPKTSEHECSTNTTNYSDTGVFDNKRFLTFFLEATFIGLIPMIWGFCAAIFWYVAYQRAFKVQKKRRGRSYFNYFIISNIVVLFLLYPTLARTSLKFYSCSYETIEGVRLLEADFNVQCWGKAHSSWLIVGLIMTIIYAIGIPLATYYVLHKNVGKLTKYKDTYGFVFAGYQQHRYYWEVVIMMRKFCFAFIAVVFRPLGDEVQGYCGALVLVIALQLQAYYRPYTNPQINFVENFGIATSFSTIFFGLFIASGDIDQSGAASMVLSVFIIFMNSAFIMYTLWLLYRTRFLGKGVLVSSPGRSKNRSSLPSEDRGSSSPSRISKKVPASIDENAVVNPKSASSVESAEALEKGKSGSIIIAEPIGSKSPGSQVVSAHVVQ